MKKITLTLVLIIGFSLTHCIEDGCGCGEFLGDYFDITGIKSVIHHERISSNAAPPLKDNSRVNFSDYYGFIVDFESNYLSEHNKSNSGSMGQLYACDCIPNGYLGSKFETYEEITITTEYDFSENHRAGDTINDLIRVNSMSISDFVSDTSRIEFDGLLFSLTEQPSSNSEFQVTVNILLNTGEQYKEISTTVKFN